MNENNTTQSNKDSILNAIKAGQVRMRPKWHFVLRGGLLLTGGAIALVGALYLSSLIVFLLRDSGMLFVPQFGMRGWFELLRSLPWLLLALVVVFVMILLVLVKHYRFAYRRPVIYSIGFLALVVVTSSYAIDRTHFHRHMHDQFKFPPTPSDGLPPPFFFNIDSMHRVHPGVVLEVIKNGLVIRERRSGSSTVVAFSPNTQFPSGKEFAPGQRVVVFGEASDTIDAFGVRIIDDE